ncbi:MAG: 3-dehydroquinate synthase [Candidatus Hydrogenedentes bacterium]|jgi:3-dehydroquinate synthase|nr:3-dehydroquinate synthase [Candidatus Hydrogenedentota bacterium]
MPRTVTVALGDRAYDIHIGRDNLYLIKDWLAAKSNRAAIGLITDSNVAPLYADAVRAQIEAAGWRCVVHVMPAGEAGKRLDRIEEICGTFLAHGLDRGDAVLALGGGVVGDIAGFAAACYMRGISYIQIPTTVVAQVDSSVGGKTAVNHPLGKNTIGMFYQPQSVIIDMELLATLPPRELRAGCAEIIKHGVIADAALFDYMEEEAERILSGDPNALVYPIARSCEIKAEVVTQDEREQGLRAILNYGHTFGHALETVSHYARFLHGEAVALGMCAAGALAKNLGLVDQHFVERQRECIARYELPIFWEDLPVEEALDAMKKDKKARSGKLKFIVPDAMGSVVQRTDISEDQARQAFYSLKIKT